MVPAVVSEEKLLSDSTLVESAKEASDEPAGGAPGAISQRAEGLRGLGGQPGGGAAGSGASAPVPAQEWACESAVPAGSQGPWEGRYQGCAWLLLGVVSPHPWEHESMNAPWGSKPPAFGASASVTFHLASVDRPPGTPAGVMGGGPQLLVSLQPRLCHLGLYLCIYVGLKLKILFQGFYC